MKREWIKREFDGGCYYQLKCGGWHLRVAECEMRNGIEQLWSMTVYCDGIGMLLRFASYKSKEEAQQSAIDYVNNLCAEWQEIK